MSEHQYDPDEAPRSAFFEAWTRFVLRHRMLLLLLLLCVTGWMGWEIRYRLRVDTSVESFISTGSEPALRLERLRDDFGRDEMFFVLVKGDVFSLPFLDKLKALHDELEQLDLPLASLGKRHRVGGRGLRESFVEQTPGPAKPPPPVALDGFVDVAGSEGWGQEKGGSLVDEITSIVNVRQTRFVGGGLEVGGLLDDWPTEADLPALKKYVLAEPSLVHRVVDPDGHYAIIMVRTEFMDQKDSDAVYRAMLKIGARHDARGFEVKVAGLPAVATALNELMIEDLSVMSVLSVLLMLGLTSWLFRHPIGVIGPVGSVIGAVVWTFGSMALFDVPMTMISNVLPGFIICCAIAEALHIQTVYRDARIRGLGNDDAIVQAIATTGVPIFYTSATTWVGFLSFWFTDVDAIRDIGSYGALGTAAALLIALLLVPILLSFNRKSLLGGSPGDSHSLGHVDRLLTALSSLSAPNRARGRGLGRVLWGTLALGIAAALAMTQLRVYHHALSWVPDDRPIKQTTLTIDQELGGAVDLSLTIEALPGKTLKDRELMLALEKLERHILAYRHPTEGKVAGGVISLLDVVRETSRATHDGAQAHYAIPATQGEVVDMLTLFENGSPEQLRRLATIDMKRSLMTVRVRWLDAGSYGPLRDYIEHGVERYVGDRAKVELTGSALTLLTIVDGLIDNQVRSFGSAFLVIALMMVWLLRDWKLGLVSMVPNFVPIFAVMGIMGLTGIPIDLANVMIGSIASGIAVDDTIHFMHQFRAHMRHHGNVEAAISHSFAHAGRAMVLTAAVLLCGFGVFVAAQIQSIARFGLLTTLTLVLALFCELIMSPALLRMLYARRPAVTLAKENEDVSVQETVG